MAKFFALILLSIICILAQSATAATFQCTDEPAACKAKFGAQFEKDFKDIHLTGARNFLTTCFDIAKALKAKLSAEAPYVLMMADDAVDTVDIMSGRLQKLNDNDDISSTIRHAILETMNALSWDVEDVPEAENIKKVLEEHNVRDALVDAINELASNTGNLWTEMYSGLREEDLKTYPEYVEVNGLLENLSGNGGRRPSSSDYHKASQILAEKFNLNYFKIKPYLF